jgi:hypothetical protein
MRLGSRVLQLPFLGALLFVASSSACSSDDEEPASKCGNGVIDSGEKCDGTKLGTATCSSATAGAKPAGTLACTKSCGFDTTKCTAGGTGGTGTGGTGGVAGTSGSGGVGTGGSGTGGSGTGGTNPGGQGGQTTGAGGAGQAGAP